MDVTLEESNTERVTSLLHEIVQQILSTNQTPDSVQKDLFFILIVVLMVENGFIPVDKDIEEINLKHNFNMSLISQWKLPTGTFESTFILSGFKSITVKLLMSPLGSTVIVNLVLNELKSETYSVCLPVSRYVVSPQATTIPMIFRDLKHFSITFKNKALSAVKSRILSHHGYASGSLIGLPEEVVHNILLKLPVYDILSICKTCSKLKPIVDNQSLWHSLVKRDFRNSVEVEDDWKELYKKKYELKCSTSNQSVIRHRRGGSMHDFMDYADYVSYIDNPMWDVII